MIKPEFGIFVDGEFVETDTNPTHCRHYSDSNKVMIQVETNNEYSDAIDILPCRYTYIESEKEIEKPIEELPMEE